MSFSVVLGCHGEPVVYPSLPLVQHMLSKSWHGWVQSRAVVGGDLGLEAEKQRVTFLPFSLDLLLSSLPEPHSLTRV